jgi:hypothetical protein
VFLQTSFSIRRWLPNFSQVCSADLLNVKVLVPCNPEEYLNLEYGNKAKWRLPKKNKYKWTNLDEKFLNWTDFQWPNTIKFYDIDGRIDVNQTLNHINSFSEIKFEKVPKDDIVDDVK